MGKKNQLMNCMNLQVPKEFLREFYDYLFYSILPDCSLWGERSSVILEPICFLKIKDLSIVDWKLIDELADDPFDRTKIRDRMEESISHADWSELEQVLYPISKNVFELVDNPFLYPGERLAKFVSGYLPKNPTVSKFIDGVCHFHPTEDANLSGPGHHALKRFAGVMERYEKNSVIALVIANDCRYGYIEKSRGSKSQFVNYMMSNLKNTSVNARIFYSKKKDKCIGVSII